MSWHPRTPREPPPRRGTRARIPRRFGGARWRCPRCRPSSRRTRTRPRGRRSASASPTWSCLRRARRSASRWRRSSHPAVGRAGGARRSSGARSAQALALYRQILAEDPDFAHLDAVRFNAGMILADAGDPQAQKFFRDLVTLNPGSAYGRKPGCAWATWRSTTGASPRASGSTRTRRRAPTRRWRSSRSTRWAGRSSTRTVSCPPRTRSARCSTSTRRTAAQIGVDIEGEAEAYLVHSLAGAGGAPAFGPYFDRVGRTSVREARADGAGPALPPLRRVPARGRSTSWSWSRYADQPEALRGRAAAGRDATSAPTSRPLVQRRASMAYAPRFAPGGAWAAAQAADSARTAGAAFARGVVSRRGVRAPRARARGRTRATSGARRGAPTRRARALAGRLRTPPDSRMGAGEASLRLADYPGALEHYARRSDPARDSIATLALLQRVAVTDAWYESTRSGDRAVGSDSLAHAVLAAGDALLARSPEHPRGADIIWRESQLAIAHGWNERAIADLERMTDAASRAIRARRWPPASGARHCSGWSASPTPVRRSRRRSRSARAQGRDSLARRAAAAMPVCAYRDAEAAVAADSTRYAQHAALFESVATRWPDYELAPRAQYRAGLAYGQAAPAARRRARAAGAGAALSAAASSRATRGCRSRGPGRPWASASRPRRPTSSSRATTPTTRARRPRGSRPPTCFAAAGPERARRRPAARVPAPLSRRRRVRAWRSSRPSRAATSAGVGPGPPGLRAARRAPRGRRRAGRRRLSHLAHYLQLAQAHPALASRGLIAQVRFLQGEEAGEAFAALRLTQPLAKSIPAKKRLLDTLLVRYRRSADLGVPEWAHASAFRMGAGARGLRRRARAQRPAGRPRRATTCARTRTCWPTRARVFSSRGEDVWTDLLRQPARQRRRRTRGSTRRARRCGSASRTASCSGPRSSSRSCLPDDAAGERNTNGDPSDSGTARQGRPAARRDASAPREKEPR